MRFLKYFHWGRVIATCVGILLVSAGWVASTTGTRLCTKMCLLEGICGALYLFVGRQPFCGGADAIGLGVLTIALAAIPPRKWWRRFTSDDRLSKKSRSD